MNSPYALAVIVGMSLYWSAPALSPVTSTIQLDSAGACRNLGALDLTRPSYDPTGCVYSVDGFLSKPVTKTVSPSTTVTLFTGVAAKAEASESYSFSGSHFDPSVQYIGRNIRLVDEGSGNASCPGCAAFPLGLSIEKGNWTSSTVPGEIDGLYVVGRQGIGDLGGVLIDVGARDGFSTVLEGLSRAFTSSGGVARSVRVQAGVVNSHDNSQAGFVAVSDLGINNVGYYCTDNLKTGSSQTGSWNDCFQAYAKGAINYRVMGDTGEIRTASNIAIGKVTPANAPLDVIGNAIISLALAIGKTTAPHASLDVEGNTAMNGTITQSGSGLSSFGTNLNGQAARISVGNGRTGNGLSYIDLIGDATYSSYGLELLRSGGANGLSRLLQRGTGELQLATQDSAPIGLYIGDNQRFEANSGGISFNGAAPIPKPRLPSSAVDLASAITLLNALRAALISYGLAQ